MLRNEPQEFSNPDEMLDDLAPGVRGYTMESFGCTYIPVIAATNPDHGDVSRYLDSLPRDHVIKVPTVTSQKLDGMLRRRGFKRDSEWAEEFGCWAEIFVRYPPAMFEPWRIGRCMIPPRGLTFFEYNPNKHGPLVPCRYATAAYR